MARVLQFLFFVLIIRPLVLIVIGLNIRHYERLPLKGPAILAANHNSHLDTMVLMSLFPLSQLRRIRPVAAADYFLSNKLLAWFALNLIHILPLKRGGPTRGEDPLGGSSESVANGDILILFPEGSRGEPETLSTFKTGIAHLAKKHPDVPVVPIFLHGLGKSLPRGEAVLVPFFCDVFIGEPLRWTGDRSTFMENLETGVKKLAEEERLAPWV